MVAFGAAHIGAGFLFGNGHTGIGEDALQRDDGRAAAMIDHRARPIEHHGLDRKTHATAPWGCAVIAAIVSSASAKAVEAPVPLVTVTTCTPGSGRVTRLWLAAEA